MNPVAMALLLVTAFALFGWSMTRRWKLLASLAPVGTARRDRPWTRLRRLVSHGFVQSKLRHRPLAGVAHRLVFAGFFILLVRSLALWGRGFTPDFDRLLLGPAGADATPALVYTFMKDVMVLGVLVGVTLFAYLRVIRREARLTLNTEGLLVLAIIALMMLADLAYDGACLALLPHVRAGCDGDAAGFCSEGARLVAPLTSARPLTWRAFPDPAGSLVALGLADVHPAVLVRLAELGFWTHAGLVLAFLNLLPYSKHFHVLTAFPNVFLARLDAPGALSPLAPSSEAITRLLDRALELPAPEDAPVGCYRVEHLEWKAGLDLFACTECGRCAESCPATLTGKRLNPKTFTLALRRHLLDAAPDIRSGVRARPPTLSELASKPPAPLPSVGSAGAELEAPVALVPGVISDDVVWACTTCGACDEECPVDIATPAKLIELRRHLVMVRGEHFPRELNATFEAMQVNGNPWGRSRLDRLEWAKGLAVPTMSERPDAEVLFWVGCAAAYDPAARGAARAMARLLERAGVRFAVLGHEEACTGDAGRRAGNELLFAELAEQNVATLKRHFAHGALRRIVTGCPHCRHTLAHEYRHLGADWPVLHSVELVLELVEAGRLRPRRPLPGRVVYHDPCYLGRYAGTYDAPRRLLAKIPELTRVEPARTRERAMCCGAGGAHMWMEEQQGERINVARARELDASGAAVIATACPFCTSMLKDGVKHLDRDRSVSTFSALELIARSCGLPED